MKRGSALFFRTRGERKYSRTFLPLRWKVFAPYNRGKKWNSRFSRGRKVGWPPGSVRAAWRRARSFEPAPPSRGLASQPAERSDYTNIAITARPNAEQHNNVAPGMSRAKS